MPDASRAISPDASNHDVAQRQLRLDAGIDARPGDPTRIRGDEHLELIKSWGRAHGWPVPDDASAVSAELLLLYRETHGTARRRDR